MNAKSLQNMLKFSLVALAASFLISCSGGGGGSSSGAASGNLGSLPNGSSVNISSTSFTTSPGSAPVSA